MKNNTRILSLFLAVIMMITFTVPAYASVPDSTFDLSQAWEVSDSGMTEEENLPTDDADPPANAPAQQDEQTTDPLSSGAPANEPLDDPADEAEASNATPGTLGMSGDLSEAEMLAAMEAWLNGLRLAGGNPMLRAAPGDTGNITHTTISIKPYDVTVPGVGRAYGSVIWRMKIKGVDAFCTQIWKLAGSGTYVAGEATTGNAATAQAVANFMASGKSNAEYVAAQVLVWESIYGDIGLYSAVIQGTNFESAYNAIKNGSATGSGLIFWISGPADQEVVTPAEVTVPETPEIPEIPDEPGDEVPPTETVTTSGCGIWLR